MSALDASAAAIAPAYLNVKLPDDDLRDRQLFLILGGDPRGRHRAGAPRTLRREWDDVPFVHTRRRSAVGLRSIGAARFSAGSLRVLLQRLREGRGLSKARAPRVVQLAFEVIDPMAQSFGFPLQLIALTSQCVALAFSVLGAFAPIGVIRVAIPVARLRRFRHAPVMPEFVAEYKTPLINYISSSCPCVLMICHSGAHRSVSRSR